MGPPPPGLWHTGRLWSQRVPPKVRLDGEAKRAASLLAQRRLLLAVLLALLLALLHGLRRFLLAFLDLDLACLVTSLRPRQLALGEGADGGADGGSGPHTSQVFLQSCFFSEL